MIRSLALLLLVVACGHSAGPHARPPAATTAEPVAPAVAHPPAQTGQPAKPLAARNDELVQKHNEVWALMGLSQRARDELNAIVLGINTQIYKNRQERPVEFAQAMHVQRSSEPLTHEAYMGSHKRRFDLLGISQPTQRELLDSTDFIWQALHGDGKFTPEQRKTAETIRDMMKAMSGPPPCCDENIFKRASTAR